MENYLTKYLTNYQQIRANSITDVKDTKMTQQAKVSINQWLITAAVGLFGIWGGYSVLQYRVDNLEKQQVEKCIEIKEAQDRLSGRVDLQTQRGQVNEKNIGIMQNDLKTISTGLAESNADIKDIQQDIKKILIKVQ